MVNISCRLWKKLKEQVKQIFNQSRIIEFKNYQFYSVLIIEPRIFKANKIQKFGVRVRIPMGGRIKSIQNLIIIGNE